MKKKLKELLEEVKEILVVLNEDGKFYADEKLTGEEKIQRYNEGTHIIMTKLFDALGEKVI